METQGRGLVVFFLSLCLIWGTTLYLYAVDTTRLALFDETTAASLILSIAAAGVPLFIGTFGVIFWYLMSINKDGERNTSCRFPIIILLEMER